MPLLKEDNIKKQVRLDSGVGIKPMSITGTKRLARRGLAVRHRQGPKTVTLVHKGNIMKFTEGAFRDWGYELAKEEFRAQIVTERESWILGNKDKDPNLSVEANAAMVEPGLEMANEAFQQQVAKEVKDCLDSIYSTHGKGQWKNKILVNDRIADSMLQQILTRADEYQVVVHAEPERRLSFRRLRGANRRAGPGAGRQHRRWFWSVRGHARHGSEICR